jgi:hypothetical protein
VQVDKHQGNKARDAEQFEQHNSCRIVVWHVHSNPVVEKPQYTKNRAKYIFWRGSSQTDLITEI